MKTIPITTEYITLGQFLKLTRIIGNGGEAKTFLFTNFVTVNGEKEDRRGKKLRNLDKVSVNGQEYVIKSDV